MTYYLSKSDWFNSSLSPEGMNLDMLNMEGRLENLLGPAIDRYSKGKTVIDLGCGTGLLGLRALEQGAKFVYFVEQDEQMVHILRNVLPKKLDRDRYSIIHKDIENLDHIDFTTEPQIAVSEFYGPRLFDEGYINYVKKIKTLFPNIISIPKKFIGKFYVCDIDYSHDIWPKNQDLIEHFKFMYREKGFAKYLNSFEKKELLGEISFDTQEGTFLNSVKFTFSENVNRMIVGEMIVENDELSYVYTHIGWICEAEDSGKSFEIYFDQDNFFNPYKKEL